MELRQHVMKAIPDKYHVRYEFITLLAMIRAHNLKTIRQLKVYIDKKEKFHSDWLAKHKREIYTSNRLKVEHAKKLDAVKVTKRLVNRYL